MKQNRDHHLGCSTDHQTLVSSWSPLARRTLRKLIFQHPALMFAVKNLDADSRLAQDRSAIEQAGAHGQEAETKNAG